MQSNVTKQIEIQELERLVLKYPQKSMELLALRGVRKFLDLYEQAVGTDIFECMIVEENVSIYIQGH